MPTPTSTRGRGGTRPGAVRPGAVRPGAVRTVPRSRRKSRRELEAYDASWGTGSVQLTATPRLRKAVEVLPVALGDADAARVQRVSQAIADEIVAILGVRRVTVFVRNTRPTNPRGELHGLYTQDKDGAAAIQVWMLTAKRGQVVAFKTFLRTLLHEICHHLDYVHFRFGGSWHTEGFYKRESSLFYRIGADDVARRQELGAAAAAAPAAVAPAAPATTATTAKTAKGMKASGPGFGPNPAPR